MWNLIQRCSLRFPESFWPGNVHALSIVAALYAGNITQNARLQKHFHLCIPSCVQYCVSSSKPERFARRPYPLSLFGEGSLWCLMLEVFQQATRSITQHLLIILVWDGNTYSQAETLPLPSSQAAVSDSTNSSTKAHQNVAIQKSAGLF